MMQRVVSEHAANLILGGLATWAVVTFFLQWMDYTFDGVDHTRWFWPFELLGFVVGWLTRLPIRVVKAVVRAARNGYRAADEGYRSGRRPR
jgi:hypothetical protein